ncbi:MAG: amidohydrolase family protein [Planctomycetota bacterium]
MNSFRRISFGLRFSVFVVGCLLVPGCATESHTAPPGSAAPLPLGTCVFVGDEHVHGYDPIAELVVEAHFPQQSRFTNIDAHAHWSLEPDPHDMIKAMDERNVFAAVNLSGGYGERLDAMADRYLSVDRQRFVIFLNLPFDRIDEPGFAEWAVSEIERAHARGVRGLKVFKSLGLYHRDAAGELVEIDDRRLDPVWRRCGELNMPVLIHTADPVAFFKPVDEKNERWLQLKRRPNWSFYGGDFPARDELLAARNRVFARHPGTTFIGAHMANNAEDLSKVRADLDAFPNLVVDISGRVAELGRQPYTARRFVLDYPDRVMFATDRYPGNPSQPRYRIYYRFLETKDEYFKYYHHPFPPAGEWKIYGIGLPDEVLRMVYYDNAARVLGLPALDRIADALPDGGYTLAPHVAKNRSAELGDGR